MTETRVPSGIILNFPGGGVELGEAPLAALRREFVEETGLEVSISDLLFATGLFQQNPDYPNEQLLHLYYRATLNGNETTFSGEASDVAGVRWVSPEETAALSIVPADREFISSESFGRLWG